MAATSPTQLVPEQPRRSSNSATFGQHDKQQTATHIFAAMPTTTRPVRAAIIRVNGGQVDDETRAISPVDICARRPVEHPSQRAGEEFVEREHDRGSPLAITPTADAERGTARLAALSPRMKCSTGKRSNSPAPSVGPSAFSAVHPDARTRLSKRFDRLTVDSPIGTPRCAGVWTRRATVWHRSLGLRPRRRAGRPSRSASFQRHHPSTGTGPRTEPVCPPAL